MCVSLRSLRSLGPQHHLVLELGGWDGVGAQGGWVSGGELPGNKVQFQTYCVASMARNKVGHFGVLWFSL